MGPGDDLPTLIGRKDHLGVLRFLRSHELREPDLVVEHGQCLLGKELSKRIGDEETRLAALEQICLAALDLGQHAAADKCLDQLRNSGIDKESVRFRRLLARCLESSGDYDGASKIYDALLKDNPANLVALQRKYCIARATKQEPEKVIESLNEYLGQNLSDVSGWYEMAQLRMSLCDFRGAAYALEQVVLGSPLDAEMHRQLAEVYATIGGLENLTLARKHMSQALELDTSNVRAQFGLVAVSNQYLEESAAVGKKDVDEHELLVAKELVKYGGSEVMKSYNGNKKMQDVFRRVMDDYTNSLDDA